MIQAKSFLVMHKKIYIYNKMGQKEGLNSPCEKYFAFVEVRYLSDSHYQSK